MIKKKCPRCGKEFEPKVAPQIYCSDECRMYNSLNDKICPICGTRFRAKKARTCSPTCSHILGDRTKKGTYQYPSKKDMRRYHSDTLDKKAKEWGHRYGEYQAKETLALAGTIDVEGFMREVKKVKKKYSLKDLKKMSKDELMDLRDSVNGLKTVMSMESKKELLNSTYWTLSRNGMIE